MNGIFLGNMKIIILLSTIALVSAASVNPSPRSVNVALETSFLFEPKDINDNISFIKNIKVFLDKLYKILAPQATVQAPEQQFRAEGDSANPGRRFELLDFMKNVGESFMNFTGPKIEDAVKILHVEITKAAEKSQSAIKDILPDTHIKDYIQDTVKQWTLTDPEELKKNVKKVMTDNNPLLNKFARRLNNYYNAEDVKKMHKTFKKFSKHAENKHNTSKIIKELLQYAIYNKYQSLNATSKLNLLKDMKLLSEFVSTKKKFKFKVQSNNKNLAVAKRKSPPTFELLFGDPITVAQNHIGSDVDLKKSRRKSKSVGDKMKIETKKNGVVTNEIVVDNVELILQSLKNL